MFVVDIIIACLLLFVNTIFHFSFKNMILVVLFFLIFIIYRNIIKIPVISTELPISGRAHFPVHFELFGKRDWYS